MFEWLAANLATIVVALIVLAVAALIVRQMVRDKKRGKGGCSCGRDCGSCGAPSCRALAEDIVRGEASRNDCIYEFIEYIQSLSGDLSYLTTEMEAAGHISPVDLQNLQHSIGKLALELRRKDV